MWTVIQGIASALGLAQALEQWLERREARNQGMAAQATIDNTATLQEAQRAQVIDSTVNAESREQLVDELLHPTPNP